MIYEEEDCCLEQWCLYVHRLKSSFSRVDSGPLFIHDSWPPTVTGRIRSDRSGSVRRLAGCNYGNSGGRVLIMAAMAAARLN
jgi:hypothetical protein